MPLVTSRRFLFHVLLFALAFLLLIRAHPARGAEGIRAHYVVFEIGQDGGIRAAAYRLVTLDGMRPSRSAGQVSEALLRSPRDADPVVVEVSDGGEVTYRDVVDVPRYLRGEFVDESGLMGSHLIPLSPRSFVVRVPVGAGGRLALRRGRAEGQADTTFALPRLASRRDLPLARFTPRVEVSVGPLVGSPANRVDLLIMGDGYMMSEQAAFNTDSANLLASFFGLSPYSEYQGFVNTSTLFTASMQSGADHPPYMAGCPNPPACCSDASAISDPKAGTYVSTAFDATFCTANIHRLLTVNGSKIFTAASAVPNWDEILVIVNDTTYGGSGGTFSTISTNVSAVNVAQHEYGHSFSRLADEYTSPYPGFPPCSDVTSPPCEPNVTDQTVRASIKWTSWIAMATPVPTPDMAPYLGIVGLFQGARYQSSGYYRPKHNCLMNSLGVPFCEICRQTYVLRLYNGGWGVPASGIDNIEPGSESPAPGMVPGCFPGSRSFTVAFLQPTTPALGVTWLVDSVPVPGATSNTYTYNFTGAGMHTVELRTHDATTFATAAMAGTSLDSNRVWTLNISTDSQAPSVTAPAAVSVSQTLCQ